MNGCVLYRRDILCDLKYDLSVFLGNFMDRFYAKVHVLIPSV